ncbi:MAG: murein hydrolase activator EnvC family protein, partial [Tepidiformaceae bacterium]
ATPTVGAAATAGASATATTAATPGDGAIEIAKPSPPPDPGIVFAFPLQSWLSIGDRYGAPRGAGYMHGGIDLNVDGNAATTLYSVCDGSFVGAGQNTNYGSYFVIDCGNQWTAVYAMVASTGLRVNEAVTAGEAVGVLGPVKDPAAGHLHFELRYHGYPMNPETYMQFGPTTGILPTPTPEPTNPAATATAPATRTPVPPAHATATPVSTGGGANNTPPPNDTPLPPPTATPTPWEPTPTPTATPPPTETVAPTRTPLPARRSPTPAPISD